VLGNFNHTEGYIGELKAIAATPKRPKSLYKQHAQKVKKPTAARLKGQKLLAQGSALGIMAISNAPCKGKSFKIHLIKL